ncbi:hypothetical protein KJ059_15395 [Myxococcota bacterium]|nr:hypothetical protein [Myxococcota bacterium]MCZ7617100.1 hypothetical protein [Myxococcota bacterium]
MKPDSEKHPQAQARPAAGKAPVIAGIVALAVVASVAWWFLGEPERLLDVDADPPPGARTDAEPIPGLPDGAADGRSRREVSPPEVAASRRVIPRLRDDPKLPPADTGIEPEDVIENEPGKDFGPGIDARDYIEALREMGETEGIAAFPPPGTDPPKTGVIVPDDYELPVGYERYYQYSDDGKPLDAILVYSSDYEFLDEQGDPIPIPEDRVVPPEAAPPDLPREMLDPEKPIESDRLIDQTP